MGISLFIQGILIESEQKGSQNMICIIDCNPDPGVPVFFIEMLFDQNRITLSEFLGLTFLGNWEICQPRKEFQNRVTVMGFRFLNFKFHGRAVFVEVLQPGRGPAEAIGLRGKDR